jgi:hypothetical protein
VATVRAAAALHGSEHVRLRPHLDARLDGDVVRSRAGDLSVAPADLEPVETLLATGTASVSVLGVDLARRLLLGGLVSIDEGSATGPADSADSADWADSAAGDPSQP